MLLKTVIIKQRPLIYTHTHTIIRYRYQITCMHIYTHTQKFCMHRYKIIYITSPKLKHILIYAEQSFSPEISIMYENSCFILTQNGNNYAYK